MNVKRFLKKYAILTSMVVLLILPSNAVIAKTYRWVVGAGLPKVSSDTQVLGDWFTEKLSQRIKAATGDDIKWISAFGGAIAKPRDELEAMEKGLLTFAPIMYPYEFAKLPMGGVFYMLPFNSTDVRMMTDIGYRLHQEIPFMHASLEKHNIKYIGHSSYDSYHLISTFPVRSIEDLKNRKIGGAGPNLAWIKAVGAVPVQTSLAEVYTSLQTGVYEAMLANITWMRTFKMYEVAKYVTYCDFGSPPVVGFGMNLNVFNSLPQNIQQIILETGAEMKDEIATRIENYLDDSIHFLKDNGVHFFQLSFDQKEKWANLMPNIPDGYIKKYESEGYPTRQIVKFVIDAQKAKGYKFPRDWKID